MLLHRSASPSAPQCIAWRFLVADSVPRRVCNPRRLFCAAAPCAACDRVMGSRDPVATALACGAVFQVFCLCLHKKTTDFSLLLSWPSFTACGPPLSGSGAAAPKGRSARFSAVKNSAGLLHLCRVTTYRSHRKTVICKVQMAATHSAVCAWRPVLISIVRRPENGLVQNEPAVQIFPCTFLSH